MNAQLRPFLTSTLEVGDTHTQQRKDAQIPGDYILHGGFLQWALPKWQSPIITRRIVNDTDVSEECVAFVLRMTELGSGRHRATLSVKAALRYQFTILHVVVRSQMSVIWERYFYFLETSNLVTFESPKYNEHSFWEMVILSSDRDQRFVRLPLTARGV